VSNSRNFVSYPRSLTPLHAKSQISTNCLEILHGDTPLHLRLGPPVKFMILYGVSEERSKSGDKKVLRTLLDFVQIRKHHV
jgi:hypothetical protein